MVLEPMVAILAKAADLKSAAGTNRHSASSVAPAWMLEYKTTEPVAVEQVVVEVCAEEPVVLRGIKLEAAGGTCHWRGTVGCCSRNSCCRFGTQRRSPQCRGLPQGGAGGDARGRADARLEEATAKRALSLTLLQEKEAEVVVVSNKVTRLEPVVAELEDKKSKLFGEKGVLAEKLEDMVSSEKADVERSLQEFRKAS